MTTTTKKHKRKVAPRTHPSAAQTKMKKNADEGRTGPPDVIDLTTLEELTLRTLFYESENIRLGIAQAEQELLKQFHSRPDISAKTAKMSAATEAFNVEMKKVHAKYGTDPATYTFFLDKKQLVKAEPNDGQGKKDTGK